MMRLEARSSAVFSAWRWYLWILIAGQRLAKDDANSCLDTMNVSPIGTCNPQPWRFSGATCH